MIEEVDLQLKSWADAILGHGVAELSPPTGRVKGKGVTFYLMDLISSPPPRAARKVRLEIWLRYLVTAWAEDPVEEHKLIGELLFAALGNADFTVETDAISSDVWKSFGIPPRPGFLLRVPLRKDLPERPVKYVRRPLVAETVPARSLSGWVSGPEEIPLSGALVELPNLRLATRTDANGRFRFLNVAAQPSDHLVRVRAKGREQTFHSAEHAQPDGSVRLNFKFHFEES